MNKSIIEILQLLENKIREDCNLALASSEAIEEMAKRISLKDIENCGVFFSTEADVASFYVGFEHGYRKFNLFDLAKSECEEIMGNGEFEDYSHIEIIIRDLRRSLAVFEDCRKKIILRDSKNE